MRWFIFGFLHPRIDSDIRRSVQQVRPIAAVILVRFVSLGALFVFAAVEGAFISDGREE